jgi:HTH-type transcriptional regulator, sugar sensing transcriptional regulator
MSQKTSNESISALSELGFTELEAAVYAYLVENSPATAYRVAQDIGKPVANTYKAVKALHQKGAVLIDETQNRLCQAVAPAEVLEKLKDAFLERHRKTADALARLKPSGDFEKIFSLATPEQVFDRCRRSIEQAETIVLVDAYPGVVKTLRPWLEEAGARGVTVVLQVYKPAQVRGVEIVEFQNAAEMLGRWKGDWLVVVVDGAEYLFAFIAEDGRTVHNAIWCGSAFMALPQHSNLALSFRASILEDLLKKDTSRKKIEKELRRVAKWETMGVRGYEKLSGVTAAVKENRKPLSEKAAE